MAKESEPHNWLMRSENFLSEMDDKGKGDFDFDSSWCQSERGDRRSLRSGPRHSPK